MPLKSSSSSFSSLSSLSTPSRMTRFRSQFWISLTPRFSEVRAAREFISTVLTVCCASMLNKPRFAHLPDLPVGLPLPKGEGRGEGEGTVQEPSSLRFDIAGTARCAVLSIGFASLPFLAAAAPLTILPSTITLHGPESRQHLILEKTLNNQFIGQITNDIQFVSNDPKIVRIEKDEAIPIT